MNSFGAGLSGHHEPPNLVLKPVLVVLAVLALFAIVVCAAAVIMGCRHRILSYGELPISVYEHVHYMYSSQVLYKHVYICTKLEIESMLSVMVSGYQ